MLQNVNFGSKMEMVEYLRGLPHADKVAIVRQFGYDVDAIGSDAKIGVLADYIVQGHQIGLDDEAKIVSYANNMTDALIGKMPHLGKPNAPKKLELQVAKPAPIVAALPVASTAVKQKPVPVAKPAPVKKAKVEKVKHPDGTIFFREDRQKWVVVIDGKQPAARPTKEGVVKWLAAKHPDIQPIFA